MTGGGKWYFCNFRLPKLFRVPANPGQTLVYRAGLAILLVALIWVAMPAFAQDSFPNRPVRLLVSFPPGGAVDLIARDLVLRPALVSSMPPTLFEGKSWGVSRGGLGGACTAR